MLSPGRPIRFADDPDDLISVPDSADNPAINSDGSAIDEVALFFERVQQCNDPIEMESLARAVNRDLAPQQLHDLYNRVKELGTNELLEVFQSKATAWRLFLRSAPSAFKNTLISPYIRLLEAEEGTRDRKVLLVVFAGMKGEMFLPLGRFLLLMPKGKFDVLILSSGRGSDFPRGVQGAGNDFFEVCKYVDTYREDYAGIVTLGQSMGGLYGLRAAVLLDLPVGISLAGRFTLLRRLDRGFEGVTGFDPLCACASRSGSSAAKPTLLAYYSADNPRDAAEADKLATMNPNVRRIPVEDWDRHNVVIKMIGDGLTAPLFLDTYRLATAGRFETETSVKAVAIAS
jgi:hypothetical protein